MKKLIFSTKQILKMVRAAVIALGLVFAAQPLVAAPTVSGGFTVNGTTVTGSGNFPTNSSFNANGSTSAYTITVNSGANLGLTTTGSNNYVIVAASGIISNYGAINAVSDSTHDASGISLQAGGSSGVVNYVTNSGSISATGGSNGEEDEFLFGGITGIRISNSTTGGTNSDVVMNTGSISAFSVNAPVGEFEEATASGVSIFNVNESSTGVVSDTLVNSGTISGVVTTANSDEFDAVAFGATVFQEGGATENISITNSGAILASGNSFASVGIYIIQGEDPTFTSAIQINNSGSIVGSTTNSVYSESFGVLVEQDSEGSATTTITNSGTIEGISTGSSSEEGVESFGIVVESFGASAGSSVNITNSGLIEGLASTSTSDANAAGIELEVEGEQPSTVTITNSGTIQGLAAGSEAQAYGVFIENDEEGAGESVTINNTGTIVGSASASSPSGANGYGILIEQEEEQGQVYATINNSGIIYGTTTGISVDSTGFETVNLTGGSVTGVNGYAVELNSPIAPTVTVTARALLVSGKPYALQSDNATGNLFLNLIGGTPVQVAAAEAAAAHKTGSFEFGGYFYSWNNFNVGLNAVSLETVVAPQYRSLAEQIDNSTSSSALPLAYDGFFVAALNNPNAALNELSGFTLIQGAQDLEIQSQQTFLSNLEEQMESLQGAGGFIVSNATIGDSSLASVNSANSQLDKLVAYAGSQMNGTETSKMMEPKTMAPVIQSDKWDVWLSGNVSLGHEDAWSGGAAYDSVNGSPMAGIDYAFTPDLKAGFLVGGTLDGANFSDGSRVNANTEIVGAYVTYNNGPWLANGVVAGGPSQYSDHRSTFGGTAKSDPDGYSFLTQGTAGYAFNLTKNVTATPEVGVQYTHVNRGSYTESGAGIFDTSVAEQDNDSFRTHLGAKLDASFDLGPNLKWIPEVRAAWYHECLDTNQQVATSLVGAPAFGSFNVSTQQVDRDYALVGVGLNSVFTGFQNVPIGMFLNYDVQVGQSQYIQHSITGGIKVSF